MDLIAVAEKHINQELLDRGKDVKEKRFRSIINNTILTKNVNELIDVMQKVGVLSSVRGELARFPRVSGVDENMLGRWTWS